MKDYASMSDFEINKAVAVATGHYHDDCDIAKIGSSLVGVEWDDDTGYATKAFDFCNNPADAWPIITENKISIYAMSETDARGKWGAEAFYPSEAYHFNDNPLRAAMIVFLMMKEGE